MVLVFPFSLAVPFVGEEFTDDDVLTNGEDIATGVVFGLGVILFKPLILLAVFGDVVVVFIVLVRILPCGYGE